MVAILEPAAGPVEVGRRTVWLACRCCSRAKVIRPRGPCWTCYYTPGVKERFQPVSKFGRRLSEDVVGRVRLPDRPTDAPPGSPEKIEVMAERVVARVALHHPFDARPWGPGGLL